MFEIVFTGLWFLTVLFVLVVVGALIYQVACKRLFYLFWLLAFAIVYFVPGFWVINNIKYLMPFFVFGIACRRVKWERMPVWLGIIWLIAYVICLRNFDFSCSMYEMQNDMLSSDYLKKTALRMAGGTAGIMASLFIIRLIMRFPFSFLKNTLCRWGVVTLPIYVLHQRFLAINRFVGIQTCNILFLMVISTIVLLLSIAAYRLLRKSRILALIIFGENTERHETN